MTLFSKLIPRPFLCGWMDLADDYSDFEFWNVTFSMDGKSDGVPSVQFKFTLP